mmetsp:Transcript_49157/g.159303  ORF Transcript_49157/g.159303 Transcript_49157/m.159303 type:complete len:100 (+) Transcript_49157:169-468(+)
MPAIASANAALSQTTGAAGSSLEAAIGTSAGAGVSALAGGRSDASLRFMEEEEGEGEDEEEELIDPQLLSDPGARSSRDCAEIWLRSGRNLAEVEAETR